MTKIKDKEKTVKSAREKQATNNIQWNSHKAIS